MKTLLPIHSISCRFPACPALVSGPARRWSRTLVGALGALLLVASPTRGAVWQSPNWAVGSTLAAETGYDGNLYLRNGASDGTYAAAEAGLRLFRRQSLTRLELTAALRALEFISGDAEGSIDPSLQLLYRYPFDNEVRAVQEIRAGISSRTRANADTGTRLRSVQSNLNWQGRVLPTGKLQLVGRLGYNRTAFDTEENDWNDNLNAGATLDLFSNDRRDIGIGYDYSQARAQSDIGNTTDSRRSHAITLRGRGEILPKVTGDFYVGADQAKYSGECDCTDWAAIAEASLAWRMTERRRLALLLDRHTYYSPTGDVVGFSAVGLEFTQQIAGGFTGRAGIEFTESRFENRITPRHDEATRFRAGLGYNLTTRLSAALDVDVTRQDSTEERFTYNRTAVQARLSTTF